LVLNQDPLSPQVVSLHGWGGALAGCCAAGHGQRLAVYHTAATPGELPAAKAAWQAHGAAVSALHASPYGMQLVSGAADGSLHLCGPSCGRPLTLFLTLLHPILRTRPRPRHGFAARSASLAPRCLASAPSLPAAALRAAAAQRAGAASLRRAPPQAVPAPAASRIPRPGQKVGLALVIHGSP